MNKFGRKSMGLINKSGFNPKLKQFLLYAELKLPNCTITDTYRTAEEQSKFYNDGVSKCDGYIKKSKHQSGNAFDIIPYPSMYEATVKEWIELYSAIMISLNEFNKIEGQSLELSWGGFWNKTKNEIGWDCPHYEIKEAL